MRRWRRAAVVFGAALGVAACGLLVAVLVGRGVAEASLWAAVLAAVAGVIGAGAVLWPLAAGSSKALAPTRLQVPAWVVGRPAELSAVVAQVLESRARSVGITTALHGAGGFGKTTLALMVSADRRVRRRFGEHVYLVTVGRDARGAAALAARVNDLIGLVAGEDATFTDPDAAGRRLGSLLDAGPRRLLILDDVWSSEQLGPFTSGGRRCVRLVTTRMPGLVEGRAVRVDQMSSGQARELLTSGLPPVDPALADRLLAATGRWPLLLRLVNKILVNAVHAGVGLPRSAAMLVERLEAGGPVVVDDLSGQPGDGLEVDQPHERARAVRATIAASTSQLDPPSMQRFAELGVFAEDETIPFTLLSGLWRATAGLDELQASQLSARLRDLALVSASGDLTGGLGLHDVIRDFLRAELGAPRLTELNAQLLDVAAAQLPLAERPGGEVSAPPLTAWWELAAGDRYLYDHLIEHLLGAGRRPEAEAVACDLRWVTARLQASGPAAPVADLALVGTPQAGHFRVVLERAAHLLAPTDPPEAVIDVLHSRATADPHWAGQVAELRARCRWPRLVNRWLLPDLPDAALLRTLTGPDGEYSKTVLAISHDGTWMAAGRRNVVRIWDTSTWDERAIFSHPGWVLAIVIAPDDTWLATFAGDGKLRIWDLATRHGRIARSAWVRGSLKHSEAAAISPDGTWMVIRYGTWMVIRYRFDSVRLWRVNDRRKGRVIKSSSESEMAIAPDGTWLAAGDQTTVRIWDASTGQERAAFTGHASTVSSIVIAPDGTWLAATCDDGTVRLWDVTAGRERGALTGHRYGVTRTAITPDGTWLITGDSEGAIRVWDANAVAGQDTASISRSSPVDAIATAPDGRWLATRSSDSTTFSIWNPATGRELAVLSSHTRLPYSPNIAAVAADGTWLVTSDGDRTMRAWDTATGRQLAAVTSRIQSPDSIAIAPDGSWIAIRNSDATIRIRDIASGEEQSALTGHGSKASVTAIAPDGSWLALTHTDDWTIIRIWDTATGQQRAAIPDREGKLYQEMAIAAKHSAPKAQFYAAMAPDGSWLATKEFNRTSVTRRYTGVTIRIWDTATEQERVTITGLVELEIKAIAPDASWLALGENNRFSGDYKVRIWDLKTGSERAAFTGRAGPWSMAITADGNLLAAGGKDGAIRIWDTSARKVIAMMRVQGRIDALAWLDGSSLAVGGTGGLYLFDLLPAPTQTCTSTTPKPGRS